MGAWKNKKNIPISVLTDTFVTTPEIFIPYLKINNKKNMNCNDFMSELEKYQKEHPIKVFFNRLWFIITELPDNTKTLFQRVFRGYADRDVYNLNFFILKKIYKPFIAFIRYQEEKGKSLPMEFASDPAAWLVVLSKIEYSLTEAYKTEFDTEYDTSENYLKMTQEQKDEHNKKMEEGFTLLGKYLMDLWD